MSNEISCCFFAILLFPREIPGLLTLVPHTFDSKKSGFVVGSEEGVREKGDVRAHAFSCCTFLRDFLKRYVLMR
jgi:hypothetical protein